MRFEIETITPEKAAQWLNHNTGNRALRERRAAAYAQAISDGKWVLTPDPIALGKRGRLLNGQHRLRGIMLANRSVQMAVAYDVPDEAFAVMDAGLPRSMYERLRSDKRHTSILSTMYRLLSPRRVAQEYEVSLLLSIFGDALHRLDSAGGPRHSKVDKSSQQCAFLLRVSAALKKNSEDEVLRIIWLIDKLRRGDMVGAPPLIGVYYRQLMEGGRSSILGVSPLTDQFCRAWLALDPDKEGVARLSITDHSEVVREAKLLFKELTENVFD